MTDLEKLLAKCTGNVAAGCILEFSAEDLALLDRETAHGFVAALGGSVLMRLPEKEIRFFEWLREHDEPIWQDLWGEASDALYVVGIALLPLLLDNVRGFPICDLLSNDNYYFTPIHILGGEAEYYLAAVKERFLAKEKLTPAQLLALEISMAPIDVWHFGYHHGISPESAKRAAEHLVGDGIIIHFRKAEELANFVEF
ncbi:hypothetical protein MASR2M18_20640 [Ignavibacteria bacterium]|jgi:hypothetical protein|nr:hypothetical protein [Bacteroidota bacterium]MCZ2131958.1 hypothetical protein [Bacteroidota bacterium]